MDIKNPQTRPNTFRFYIFLQKLLILAQKKPPRCISARGGSVLIAQEVYARVSISED